jgi:hypothetical protein
MNQSGSKEDAGGERIAPAKDSIVLYHASPQERKGASDGTCHEDREKKSEFDAEHEFDRLSSPRMSAEAFSGGGSLAGEAGQKSRCDAGVQSGTDGHGLLVEHHLARMAGRRMLRSWGTDAEEDHCSWRLLKYVRKVFGAHDRDVESQHGLGAEKIRRDGTCKSLEVRIIDDDRVSRCETDIRLGSMGLGDAFDDARETLEHDRTCTFG